MTDPIQILAHAR